MKALTVRQPWAWAIIHGGKNVENRSRNIAGSYRGPLAIHAGRLWDESCPDNLRVLAGMAPRGRIVGIVDLIDAHRSRFARGATTAGQPCCFKDGVPIGERCSAWAHVEQADLWHLELANPRPFAEPIPYKGRLGLFDVPDDLLADSLAGFPNPNQQETK